MGSNPGPAGLATADGTETAALAGLDNLELRQARHSAGDRVVLLSSRPGRVIDEFAVPISHPRRIDSAPVAELAARVTDRLREEMSSDGH